MDISLFLVAFLSLGIMYLIIGIMASKKVHSNADYFLAGKSLTIPAVTFTLIATQLGGGMLLGTAQEAYTNGLYGIAYTAGICIGFLLLAFCFAERLQALQVATTAELFETRYHSTTLKKIASILSIITMSGILIAQVIGSKSFLASIGFYNEYAFLLFWAFTIFYTMVGGLQAVVWTDTAQVCLIMLVFGYLFIQSIYQNPHSLLTLCKPHTLFKEISFNRTLFFSTMLIPALFSLIEQDIAQRFFAAKNGFVARISALCAALFLIIFACIPIYFGMQAKITGIPLAGHTSPLMPMLATISGGFLLALAACAIIAAINSTADSLLCAISSNIAQDFDLSFLPGTQLIRSKAITLIVGIFAVGASYFMTQNIISIIVQSYELSVYCLFVPLVACYFIDTVKKKAAITSLIFSLSSLLYFWIGNSAESKTAITLSASIIGYVIGWFL